jgi:predicted dithiol-disulfide oxidoreductase (DUF899 family)
VAFLDQLEGAAEHASQRLNLAVVAKAPLPRVLAFAKERGWAPAETLVVGRQQLHRDYHAETLEGAQRLMLTVFHRDGEEIRWSGIITSSGVRHAGAAGSRVSNCQP